MPTEPLVTEPSPSVSDAIATRRSVRAFLPDPVPEALVREIVGRAARAASGGNLQPWKLTILTGAKRDELVAAVRAKQEESPFGDGPEYDIYPRQLGEPYRSWRGRVAAEMYGLVGIARDDTAARVAQMNRNYCFFDAPVGMILSIDRQMGPPQFCDLGLFLGNLMLLAREHGLHTCPQEAWSLWGKTIRAVTGIPEHELVFCGVALGHADPEAPINALYTERAAFDDFARWLD